MAGILVSPQLDSKIRKRNALYKKRNESPKFRDILRERCRARIRASRCALLDKFRDLKDTEELNSTLSGILHEEVKILTQNPLGIPLPPESFFVEPEPLNEQDKDLRLLLEQYEKVLSEEELTYDWEDQVVCPLCEMSILSSAIHTFSGTPLTMTCLKCHVQFPQVNSIETFRNSIDTELRLHSENCFEKATFANIDDKITSGLFLICETCGFFSQAL